MDWNLLEANWDRLAFIDLIQLAQIEKGSLPKAIAIIQKARAHFKQKLPSPIYDDLALALKLEDQLPLISEEEDIKIIEDVGHFLDYRVYRLARKIKEGSPMEEIYSAQILDAAKEGLYPEDALLAYFRRRQFPPGGGGLWSALDHYPSVLKLALSRVELPKYEFIALMSRIIERNYSETFKVLTEWMRKTHWQIQGYYLLLRPYLLKEANLKLLEELRLKFGLDDFEYRARLNGKPVQSYPEKGFLAKDTYKGYRTAWHFLEYAAKDQRPLLLKHWHGPGGFDCTYEAFVDWVNWHKGAKVLLSSDAATDQKILSLMAEI